MKTACLWLSWIAFLLGASCASERSAAKYPIALTITVQGKPASPTQREAAITRYLSTPDARNVVVVPNSSDANEVRHLNFIPDPRDPEHQGQVVVLGTTLHTKKPAPSFVEKPEPPDWHLSNKGGD